MGLITTVTFLTTSFLCIIVPIEAARILAIIPIPSYSHQIPYRPIWTTLSRRGHEVVLLTTNPINDNSLTNLTEINFESTYNLIKSLDFVKIMDLIWILALRKQLWSFCHAITEQVYEHPEVRKMYAPDSGQKFDLVIAENVCTPSLYALAHRVNAPLIGVTSLGLHNSHFYLYGAPVLPSHPSSWEMDRKMGFNLPLWRRIENFFQLWYHIYLTLNQFYPEQQMIAEKYLGKNIPDILDMERNMSIILCNRQEALSFVRPKTPNIIPFGNFHISKNPEVLPKNLQQFITDAPNGFIYVSLGTNVKMSSLSEDMQNIFRDVFASLPCKVIWKFDGELKNKPDNIYIAQWFRQQSILANPKIRMFVYQGGLQSTEEAVYYAVPLLGLPVLADQYSHVKKMVTLGVAKYLNLMEVSKETLNASILEILNDKRYKERMIEVKKLNEDKPYDLLENAIWWIEFVIRHKGAPHLHTSIVHDPWYQRYDIDIIAIFSIVIFVILFCVLIITYKLIKILFTCFAKAPVDFRKKTN